MADTQAAERTQQLGAKLIEIRRQLHQHPELSNEEFATTKAIQEWLTEAGIRIVDYGLKTGVVAEVGGKRSGPVLALRADIDALPIQEETGLSYASQVAGKMHACGHDYHTASLIGAALLLKQREETLAGTVRFIFQPSEEKATGAQAVIASGALEGVQAIYGIHNKPDLPVGTIGIKPGPMMAAADGFVVEVTGKGSHAAVPEASIDPIVTAAHIVTALQSIVSRNVSPLLSAVISVTRIQSGTAWNVIAEKAVFDGTIRTFDEQVRQRVLERFKQVAENVAVAFGATAAVRWIKGPPAVQNDAALVEAAVAAAHDALLNVIEPLPSSAGEDFAYYQKQVPGLFFFMGTAGPQEWHHPAFDVDEQALPLTAVYFANLASRYLETFGEANEQ
ncbi:amidohydrolase [Paenibacillus algorifonticola]|uniref:Amidohydrolase n=1 Tax=Paenibacillus algorifonticola TaxID=684063 RepID=A0A1I2G1P1_9BACL|nr:amidohydrolase [Paenibacillus algorifonticola]SFF11003.1 amidohydrolase [Paenibacillus algorifonticola]